MTDSIDKVAKELRGECRFVGCGGRFVCETCQLADRLDALISQEWLTIESAPENVELLVFFPGYSGKQLAATLVERENSVGGFYWRPSDYMLQTLVNDELNPTHWQPLPPPPAGDKE